METEKRQDVAGDNEHEERQFGDGTGELVLLPPGSCDGGLTFPCSKPKGHTGPHYFYRP